MRDPIWVESLLRASRQSGDCRARRPREHVWYSCHDSGVSKTLSRQV